MVKQNMSISNLTIETNPELTLEEICNTCGVSVEFIQELIQHGILDIDNIAIEHYRFHPVHMRKVRTVIHLQTDLEVNLPGAALVIDLMEELDELRKKIEMYEKHLLIK
jgi:chaperone modulatory protein CbpM